MDDRDDSFLARWSRRKAQVRQGVAVEPVPAALPATPAIVPQTPPEPPAPASLAPELADAPPAPGTPAAPPGPTLDDVARLTRESDYTPFVARGVDPGVKNAALKKLFSDPQFNVMDGLDVYIDDYGKPDPIPPGMLRQLTQGRFLGLFADDEAQPAPPPGDPALPDAAAGTAAAAAPPQPETAPDEDPDLRLQPDDAARCEDGLDDRPGPGADAAGQR